MRPSIIALLTLPMLGACTVGSDHERPKVAGTEAGWTIAAVDAGTLDLEPWRALGDPVLTGLIRQAVANNLDLKQAQARLREARAGLDFAAGGRLPQLSAGTTATRQRLSENGQLPIGSIPGFQPEFSLFDGGFDASWEIDLWGGQRRERQAASSRVAAAQAEQQEVRLRVVAEVERAYAELRGAQAEAQVARADAEAQARLAALIRQSYEAGEIGRSDDVAALAQLRRTEPVIAAAQARISAAMNALALLTGQPPEGLSEQLSQPGAIPLAPASVAPGLRADVLRRRPDVIAAEALLAAATADVGVATASLFPRFSLLGGIGQQARSLGDIASGDSTRFQIGPSLSWPIFAGGRVRAQIRAADARAEGAAAAYEQAVLGALADSETALNRYNAALSAAQAQEAARAYGATQRDLAHQRYKSGEDSLVQTLQEDLRYNAAVRVADEARMQALQAHAALVKALGGGWAEKGGDAEAR